MFREAESLRTTGKIAAKCTVRTGFKMVVYRNYIQTLQLFTKLIRTFLDSLCIVLLMYEKHLRPLQIFVSYEGKTDTFQKQNGY